MKKYLAILLTALMLLTFTACAQGSAQETKPVGTVSVQTEPESEIQVQTEGATETTVPEETEAPTEMPIDIETLYKEEFDQEDGTHVTRYRLGGPEGPVLRKISENPERYSGDYVEFDYNLEGIIIRWKHMSKSGLQYECFYYPNGCLIKETVLYKNGQYEETLFMDNGTADPTTGDYTDGTISYWKKVSPDGTVTEAVSEIITEADGSYWVNTGDMDGVTMQTHCRADGTRITEFWQDENAYTDTEYYENGSIKVLVEEDYITGIRMDYYYYPSEVCKEIFFEDSIKGIKAHIEFYETGTIKYIIYVGEDETKEQYSVDKDGRFIKYIRNDVAYEGDMIPDAAKQMFQTMEKEILEYIAQ